MITSELIIRFFLHMTYHRINYYPYNYLILAYFMNLYPISSMDCLLRDSNYTPVAKKTYRKTRSFTFFYLENFSISEKKSYLFITDQLIFLICEFLKNGEKRYISSYKLNFKEAIRINFIVYMINKRGDCVHTLSHMGLEKIVNLSLT